MFTKSLVAPLFEKSGDGCGLRYLRELSSRKGVE
jgi:hypothetical protein